MEGDEPIYLYFIWESIVCGPWNACRYTRYIFSAWTNPRETTLRQYLYALKYLNFFLGLGVLESLPPVHPWKSCYHQHSSSPPFPCKIKKLPLLLPGQPEVLAPLFSRFVGGRVMATSLQQEVLRGQNCSIQDVLKAYLSDSFTGAQCL